MLSSISPFSIHLLFCHKQTNTKHTHTHTSIYIYIYASRGPNRSPDIQQILCVQREWYVTPNLGWMVWWCVEFIDGAVCVLVLYIYIYIVVVCIYGSTNSKRTQRVLLFFIISIGWVPYLVHAIDTTFVDQVLDVR